MDRRERFPTGLVYFLLACVFVAAAFTQGSYTVDVVQDMRGRYPLKPFGLADSGPTIQWLNPSGARAGLQVGDRVIAIGGRPAIGLATLAGAVRSTSPGDTLTVSVDHGGRRGDYRLTIEPLRDHPRWYYAAVAWILMPWLSIALGFWVAAMRPRDLRAWLTLGILLGLSQLTTSGVLDPLGWPLAIGLTARAVRVLAESIWGVSMLLFGIYFPQRWNVDERVPWIKWVLVAAIGVPTLADVIHALAVAVDFQAASALPRNPIPAIAQFWIESAIISIFFVGISAKFQSPGLHPDERRRLKLLYCGCSASMTPLFLLIVFDLVIRHRMAGDADGDLLALALMATVLFPLTMAYVIVVQRAMDVRMVVRQGLQYALARRGIRVIQVCLGASVIFLAVMMAEMPGVNRPRRATWIALGIAMALAIRPLGEYLRRWLDRRFFREAYDAEQILSELSEQVRSILDRHALLETVARKISESLHVERIAVMLMEGGAFRPALAAGYPVPFDIAISPEAAAVGSLRDTREPSQVEDADTELAPLGAQILLPLASTKDLLGFISLGPKKSEEPYSRSDTNLLRTVAVQTGLALENTRLSEAIAREVAEREMLHREIEIAREVQQRLFPQSQPEIPALEYAGHCRPARGVGGDYYDFLALSGGSLGLAIGDVSGKGIPAALLMASLQASVRGQSQGSSGNVAELMSNVNRLVADASPENRYATFFYGQFDPAARTLTYSNGGHNPPILLRGEETILLDKGGPPVGLFRFSRYEQDRIQLLPGDLLVLYTDGVSEAENPAEEEWGEEALIATTRACAAETPAEMITHVMKAADDFASGAPQHDDMTLVIARVAPAR